VYKDRAVASKEMMFVGLLIGNTGFLKYEIKVDYYVPMPIKINYSSSGRDGNAEGVLLK
jgi:NADH dehydrogenase